MWASLASNTSPRKGRGQVVRSRNDCKGDAVSRGEIEDRNRNGTYSDKLDMAMFKVNRKEKESSIRCSRTWSRVREKTPFEYITKQPTDEQVACNAVSSHGKANCNGHS
jgi:hypothetical protein